MQDAFPGVLDGHESRTPKSCCPLYAVHSLSRGNLKNLMPRSITFVCPLYCCSSKHNNEALRITFNFCKTVNTSSMALATVNIDKIIKVTSASCARLSATAGSARWWWRQGGGDLGGTTGGSPLKYLCGGT